VNSGNSDLVLGLITATRTVIRMLYITSKTTPSETFLTTEQADSKDLYQIMDYQQSTMEATSASAVRHHISL
jgi:hypothetical protein